MEKYRKEWSEYYDATREKPPRPLLLEAIEYVSNKNKAIDIGGGALRDTKYLLERGFDVTVIDKEPMVAEEIEEIKTEKLHYTLTTFDAFDFPENEYDLGSAMYALPFNPTETFDAMFGRIKKSLKPGGIFCGQFFGPRDEWNTGDGKMSFHTREQIEKLLEGFEVISLKEEEKDDTTATGATKHWHIFHVIAKKTT